MKFKYSRVLKNIRKLLVLTILPFLLTACATEGFKQTQAGTYQIKARPWTNKPNDARNSAVMEAFKKCAQLSQSMEPISGGFTDDSIGRVYLLNFRCYNTAERAAQARAEKQRLDAERQRLDAQRAEQARQVEQERQRQAAEWERGRPQREAEARAAQAQERSRLNGICPIYYIARQSCANSGNGYDQCMTIRIGKTYSSWDDRTCFNR